MTSAGRHLTPAIEAIGLVRTFGNVTAVDHLDLSVNQGELFALLGPNGAGKTTTIKMLCCLSRPSGGTAKVMGHDVQADALSVKETIAVSPQETAIAENLNAWENLELMAGLHGIGRHDAKARAGEFLELMGLTDRAKDRVKKYSGGMKRRLSIAMALVSDPQVLFLDEPTLGLDPQSRRAIWEYIATLKGDKTILLTTHYLEEADALADRIAIIDDGKVAALGSAAELKDSISDGEPMVVEATGLTDVDLDALRQKYSDVRPMEGGVEIRDDRATLSDIQDVLRPGDIIVQSSYRKQVTLDDVFLHFTGKELRQ